MTTAKQEEVDMQWETPSYIDVSMNAEIGAYQDDFGEMIPAAQVIRKRFIPGCRNINPAASKCKPCQPEDV
jgi:hypothetical protein